jgi:hypothetical protein
VITVTQAQLDGENDHKISRGIGVNLVPDAANSPAIQLRLTIKRTGNTKPRTFTFDLQVAK